jgi:ATP-binding cassette subfamily C protein
VDVLKWRSVIGYVPQESILFYDTIENNITLGDRSIDKETINRAVINSGVMDFISKMPLGIHSIVGERGLKLSGGQKQRILIARALARNPKLLILDEATASLDPKTEKEILVSMMQLCSEGMTIIAISHQQALKKISDNIIQIP